MSETITVEGDAPIRQPRQPLERTMTQPEATVAVVTGDDPASGPTPEQMLAETQAALRSSEQARTVAEQTAGRAQREAERAKAGRTTDRSAAVAGQVEAAKSAKTAAGAKLRAARESGDIESEMAALEEFNAASYRETSAGAELATLKAGGEPTSAAGHTTEQPAANGGYSAAAQAWISAHPRFNGDAAYKGRILAAHEAAVRDGIVLESPAYFRELDRTHAEIEGGRQNGGEQRNGQMSQDRGFNGAPPGRGADAPASSGGGNGVVITMLGPVTVARRTDGKITVKVPRHLQPDFEEGAKVTGMALGDYIYDQVKIAEERAAGGNASLIIREGETYR